MKKILSLVLTLLLVACGGGGGGSNSGATNTQPTNAPDPSIPNILDELSAAEQLFGQGKGTGATPTDLLAQTDNLGFDYWSFGAWGKVYNLKESDTTKMVVVYGAETPYNAFIQGDHLEFTTQQLQTMQNWTYARDGSVANAIYTGPAIMYYMPHNPTGNVTESDYGTMQLRYGNDISDTTLNFVMHNPANNASLNSTDNVYSTRFSEDRNNVVVVYGTWENNAHNLRVYHGYGARQ